MTRIDPKNGLLAYEGEEDAIDEVFLDGTAPEAVSTPLAPSDNAGTMVVPGAGLDDAGAPSPEQVNVGPRPIPAQEPPPF